MKNKFLVMSILVSFLSISMLSNAQVKEKTSVYAIKQNNSIVELTLTSTKPFIIGGNAYMLYIGQQRFTLNKQEIKEGKNYITFLIPQKDFSALVDGTSMWLLYGDLNTITNGSVDLNAFAQENPHTCWSIGKLKKKSLKK